MVKGSVYSSSRPSSSLGSSHSRSNAVPLSIPRNLVRDSTGSKEVRPSFDSLRESGDHDARSLGRFHSPGKYPGHSPGSSHGMDSFSPLSLRRPVERRKEPQQKPAEPIVILRKEGFETRQEGFQAAHPISLSSTTSSGLSCSPPQTPEPTVPAARTDSSAQAQPTEKRPEGLLSRTFSSRVSNPEALKIVQEKLEHCLGSRPSIGQDIDGESISHLRRLAERHPIFKSPSVGVAYNIASMFFNDTERGRQVMRLCVESACILAELGADEIIVSAALLKDILSKSMMTEEQLKPLVPKAVSALVIKVGRLEDVCQIRQQMVDVAKGGKLDAKSSQNFNHLLMTLADYKGVLVKLADRVVDLQHSVRTNAAHTRRSAAEALEVFAPMANRLGVWSLKAMLEDLAFQVLHPTEHSELHSRLRESQDRGTIEGALDELSSVLQATNIKPADLSGRPKSLYGVMRKMQDKKKKIDQVYDVRALRVIVSSKNDCYAVLREVYKLWPEVGDCFKDYIRKPKPNGYRSLHTVVRLPDGQPMEIQIRTDKMHFIAEYGVAAHWRYKEKDSKITSRAEEQQVNWARWLISWSLELRDFKCRPRGSPPNNSGFAQLANQICSFPKHGLDCEFAAWASKSLPQPVSEEQMAEQPTMVVCMDHTSGEALPLTSIKELPPQTSVKDLATALQYPQGSHVLINTLEATDGAQILASGDRIEIFSAPKAQQRLSKEELELQRERLKRLFGHSPSDYGSPKWNVEPQRVAPTSRLGSASLV